VNQPFDLVTEGAREREHMRRVRGGEIAPEDVERESLPFFVKIQIQTVSPCNADCVMCTWSQTKHALPQGRMSEATFARIVEQIAGRGVERTSLFLMNEPTLDRRLEQLTALLKSREPRTAAVIFTNGTLLNGARAESLAAAGMDEIDISVIGFDRATHERNMPGADFERVMRNLEEVARAWRAGRLGSMKLKVVGLEMPGVAEGVAAFSERTGFEVLLKACTNDGGHVETLPLGVDVAKTAAPRACQRPFVKAYVLYNGDMVLCNVDWMRTTIVGNVNECSLEQLWRSQTLMEIRRRHVRGSYPSGSICGRCDYPYLP
jgi:MoaA/NifB/PqqE/SkfB family radical SAM enzyme